MIARTYSYVLRTCKKAVLHGGRNPYNLSSAFSLGVYIAFCPFIGFHTLMVFASRWLFGLNLPLLFAGAALNNPWTMVPIYVLDYSFGYWVLHRLFNIHPTWVISLEKIFGSGEICLWSFLLGGNVLGIVIAFASYPFMAYAFRRMVTQQQDISAT